MSRRPKTPKVRHVWGINPKTRIVPNKKRDLEICGLCGGTGVSCTLVSAEAAYPDCLRCGGTGYAR